MRVHHQRPTERGYHLCVEQGGSGSAGEGEGRVSDFHHFCSRPFSIVVNPSQTIRKVLSLPATTTMEYKSNNGEYISTRQYFLSDILIGDQTRCKINQASASPPKQTEARIHDTIHPTLQYRELPHLRTPEKNMRGKVHSYLSRYQRILSSVWFPYWLSGFVD